MSPLSHTVDGIRWLADAGVGAIVLHSLFEEQLREEADLNSRLVDEGIESFAESRCPINPISSSATSRSFNTSRTRSPCRSRSSSACISARTARSCCENEAGADALVLFNRFLQPTIDLKRSPSSPPSHSRARPTHCCCRRGLRCCAAACARRLRALRGSRTPPTSPGTRSGRGCGDDRLGTAAPRT